MTDYLFMILDLGTTSFVNISVFTTLNKISPLIKKIGSMYIDFDDYPCYSGKKSANFKKELIKVFNVIIVIIILHAKTIVHMG